MYTLLTHTQKLATFFYIPFRQRDCIGLYLQFKKFERKVHLVLFATMQIGRFFESLSFVSNSWTAYSQVDERHQSDSKEKYEEKNVCSKKMMSLICFWNLMYEIEFGRWRSQELLLRFEIEQSECLVTVPIKSISSFDKVQKENENLENDLHRPKGNEKKSSSHKQVAYWAYLCIQRYKMCSFSVDLARPQSHCFSDDLIRHFLRAQYIFVYVQAQWSIA